MQRINIHRAPDHHYVILTSGTVSSTNSKSRGKTFCKAMSLEIIPAMPAITSQIPAVIFEINRLGSGGIEVGTSNRAIFISGKSLDVRNEKLEFFGADVLDKTMEAYNGAVSHVILAVLE